MGLESLIVLLLSFVTKISVADSGADSIFIPFLFSSDFFFEIFVKWSSRFLVTAAIDSSAVFLNSMIVGAKVTIFLSSLITFLFVPPNKVFNEVDGLFISLKSLSPVEVTVALHDETEKDTTGGGKKRF